MDSLLEALSTGLETVVRAFQADHSQQQLSRVKSKFIQVSLLFFSLLSSALRFGTSVLLISFLVSDVCERNENPLLKTAAIKIP